MDVLNPIAQATGVSLAAAALIVGLPVLFFGRRLYWLFVAAVGFLAGFTFAPLLIGDASVALRIVVGLILGIIGALLAVFLQRILLIIAGAIGLGSIGAAFAASLGITDPLRLIVIVIFAIVGIIAVAMLFDWGLVVISALVGASLVTTAIGASVALTSGVDFILLLVFAVLGIGVQARDLRLRRR